MQRRELVGKVVQLQVHPDFVLQDERYDPTRLVETHRLSVTADGVAGRVGDAWVLDVHHAAYPGRHPGRLRPVSVGFTAAYDRMRERFGGTARLGVAGENIIVSSNRLPAIDELATGVEIVGIGGASLHLADAMVANPCLEFTSYLLGREAKGSQDEIGDDRAFLRNGMRGYILSTAGRSPIEIAVGADVYLVDAPVAAVR